MTELLIESSGLMNLSHQSDSEQGETRMNSYFGPLVLPYPPSANRYWRHRSLPRGGIATYVSKDGKVFRETVHKLLRDAGIRSPIAGRVGIDYALYPNRPQDYRTRMRKLGEAWHDTVQCIDLDNAQKALLDALKGVAFEDDAWVREIVARRAEPDGAARLEVRIWAIETERHQAALELA